MDTVEETLVPLVATHQLNRTGQKEKKSRMTNNDCGPMDYRNCTWSWAENDTLDEANAPSMNKLLSSYQTIEVGEWQPTRIIPDSTTTILEAAVINVANDGDSHEIKEKTTKKARLERSVSVLVDLTPPLLHPESDVQETGVEVTSTSFQDRYQVRGKQQSKESHGFACQVPPVSDLIKIRDASRINIIPVLRSSPYVPQRADNYRTYRMRFPSAYKTKFDNMVIYGHPDLRWSDFHQEVVYSKRVCSGFPNCDACGPVANDQWPCKEDEWTSGSKVKIQLLHKDGRVAPVYWIKGQHQGEK